MKKTLLESYEDMSEKFKKQYTKTEDQMTREIVYKYFKKNGGIKKDLQHISPPLSHLLKKLISSKRVVSKKRTPIPKKITTSKKSTSSKKRPNESQQHKQTIKKLKASDGTSVKKRSY
jgi:hypothetical protein